MKGNAFYVMILITLGLGSLNQTFSKPVEDQEKFIIEGIVNKNVGLICLIPLTTLNPIDTIALLKEASSQVVNGKFRFSGTIESPYGFYLKYFYNKECKYTSSVFVIEKGYQRARVDLNKPNPLVYNQTMQPFYKTEYFGKLTRIQRDAKWFGHYVDSLQVLYKITLPDSLVKVVAGIRTNLLERKTAMLWSMCDQLNTSFYSLWALYNHVATQEFKPEYEYILLGLVKSLRQNSISNAIDQMLSAANPIGVGKYFPADKYKNLKTSQFESLGNNHTYTLIEFWWSGCPGCIQHIPELKELYARYKEKGFTIVGISTDRTQELPNLKKVLEKYAVEWPGYWDENRVIAKRIGVYSYPMYLLTDSSGRIVYKKVTYDRRELAEYDEYLRKHLD